MNCGIIRDLLPAYAEGVCSDETRAAVSEHLESCEECRKEYLSMKKDIPVIDERVLDIKKAGIIKKVRKKFYIKGAMSACAGVCAFALVFAIGAAAVKYRGSDIVIAPENGVSQKAGYKIPDGASLMYKGKNEAGEPVIVAQRQDGSEAGEVPQEYIDTEEMTDRNYTFSFYRLNGSGELEFKEQEIKPKRITVTLDGKAAPWFVIDYPSPMLSGDDAGECSWTGLGAWTFLDDVIKTFDEVIYPDENAFGFGFGENGEGDRLDISFDLEDIKRAVPCVFEVYKQNEAGVSLVDVEGVSLGDRKVSMDIDIAGNAAEWNGSEMAPLDWSYHVENGEFIIDRSGENLGRQCWLRIICLTVEHTDGSRSLMQGNWVVPFTV